MKYVKKTPKPVKILQTIITLAILIKRQGLTFVKSPWKSLSYTGLMLTIPLSLNINLKGIKILKKNIMYLTVLQRVKTYMKSFKQAEIISHRQTTWELHSC